MKLIGNILWFIFIGLWSAIGFLFEGIIFCVTIIGIPFGLQAFKFAHIVVAPFGREIDMDFGSHPFANIIWLIFGGLEQAIGYLFVGVILCITVIGIPVGKQCFKLMKLACGPFGAEVK